MSDNYPSKSFKEKTNSTDELELVDIRLEKILIGPNDRAYVLIGSSDKTVCFELNSFEGSMLSFIYKGLHTNSHIQTIHQLYIRFLKDQGTNLERVVIESRAGDITYASLRFVDIKHRRYHAICSLGDALILSYLTKCSLSVVKKPWLTYDPYDDTNYEHFIIDLSPEE